MSEELIKRLWESDVASALTNEAARKIEELEQKLRTTSLEALAISDTNNELQARIAGLEDVLEEKRENINALRGLLEYSENSIALLERKWQFQMDRADASQARLSEAVNVLESIAAHEPGDGNHNLNDLIARASVNAAKSFITTLGGEK